LASRPRITPEEQAQTGRALSVVGDGGWGSVVRDAKQGGREVPPEMVDAAARLIVAWQPTPALTWVTSVPSASSGAFVDGFARRLAAALQLPYADVLRRTRPGRPQSEMENSVQQLRNIEDAFDVSGDMPDGPVLLVDDVVDSGWTLTVTAALLARAGAPAVFPFVLAKAAA
jgi:ATP-dependent DNA helicase RecQ